MKLFEELGQVIRVANVKGFERYDADTSEHVHFVCDDFSNDMFSYQRQRWEYYWKICRGNSMSIREHIEQNRQQICERIKHEHPESSVQFNRNYVIQRQMYPWYYNKNIAIKYYMDKLLAMRHVFRKRII